MGRTGNGLKPSRSLMLRAVPPGAGPAAARHSLELARRERGLTCGMRLAGATTPSETSDVARSASARGTNHARITAAVAECPCRSRRTANRAARRAKRRDWEARRVRWRRGQPTVRCSPRSSRREPREGWNCRSTLGHGNEEPMGPVSRNRRPKPRPRATRAGHRPSRSRRNWRQPAKARAPYRPAMPALRPIHSGQVSTRPAGSC
jgi:hypothetical protein